MRFAVACAAATLLVAAVSAMGQSQMEMNAQAGSDLRKSDQQLNAVYNKLRAKISDAGKAKLQTAQQSWLRFRDQECEFETMGTVGGTIHSMIVAICLTRLTDQRIKDLEAQLNCKEGDLSCGGQ
ncbi:MAG: lysozyme inhibitor LprI family protein [Reyranella sp.]|nr:lysozyme inhibitor LprI family protein [Reyranella sp.]